MSLINKISEELKYLASRYLASRDVGDKSREQIAEDERKAAEKKAREEQLAAMEREKNEVKAAEEQKIAMELERLEQEKIEREASERKQKELVDGIISDSNNHALVKQNGVCICGGLTDVDFLDGKPLSTQKVRVDICIENKIKAYVEVINDPNKYFNDTVGEFFSWKHKYSREPVVEQILDPHGNQIDISEEILSPLKNVLREIARQSIYIDLYADLNTPRFSEQYKNEHMETFRNCMQAINSIQLIKVNENIFIKANGKEISFDEKTFEFSMRKLENAVSGKFKSKPDAHDKALLGRTIGVVASREFGLESKVSVALLEEKIKKYNSLTGEDAGLCINSGLYTLIHNSEENESANVFEGFKDVTIWEAFGVMSRKIDQLKENPHVLAHLRFKNRINELCKIISAEMNEGSKVIPEFKPTEDPSIYCLGFYSVFDYKGTKIKTETIPIGKGRIDYLMPSIDLYISNPEMLSVGMNIEANQKIESLKKEQQIANHALHNIKNEKRSPKI
ncbi:hypothetical protein [Pseudomonas sp. MBLB4136]|uniref:hypothetical protein n=1 Tax=Pseudomonas sp. MBLB4136 TaxID=3451558 RepID=UPI003F74E66F